MFRILQANKLYNPTIGGVERVVQDIAEGLGDTLDMTVLVCQGKGPRVCEEVNGVKVVRCASLGCWFSMPLSPGYLLEFARRAREADLVHIHLPFPLADLALFFSGYKGKVALWWHSDIVRQKKLLALLRPWICRTVKRADLIFVSDPVLARQSEFLSPYLEKCVVVPYGVRVPEAALGLNGFLRRRLTVPGSKKILFVGRMVYYKGVGVLLEAFRQVRGAELFLVGTGPLEAEARAYVEKTRMTGKVHFLGRLSQEDLQRAYGDCDLLALPSVAASEAFGLVQIEAMAQGKPVINTGLPTAAARVSLDRETGLTVTPGDPGQLGAALQRLVDDDALRALYGRNAQARVQERYTMEKFLRGVYQNYMELITGEEGADYGDNRPGRVLSGGTVT